MVVGDYWPGFANAACEMWVHQLGVMANQWKSSVAGWFYLRLCEEPLPYIKIDYGGGYWILRQLAHLFRELAFYLGKEAVCKCLPDYDHFKGYRKLVLTILRWYLK